MATAPGGVAPVAAAPLGFTDVVVASGLASPTAVEPMPDGRILVGHKGGRISVVLGNGAVVTAATLPVCSTGEMGLLSIALDADFAANGHVYVFRTRPGAGGSCTQAARAEVLSRFTMSGTTVDPASEVVLVDAVPAWGTNHNGGTVEIGNDGFLYLGIGDSGSDPRPGGPAAAQDLSLLNGKILRITTQGAPAPGNPLLGEPNAAPCATSGLAAPPERVCAEIFAWGLRNPFRMAFDWNDGATRFRINDVGQNTWEEVDEGIAGANYGWPAREGFCPTGATTGCTPAAGLTDPIAAYRRDACRFITAGAFVPDGWWPSAYDGGYLFADGGCGRVWLLDAAGGVDLEAPFTTTSGLIADMAFGVRNNAQSLFYVTVGGGELRAITYVAPAMADPAPLRYVAYPAAQRVYDTRADIGTPRAEMRAGTSRRIDLGVPGGAAAVLANVTLDGAAAANFVVTWPPGTARPATSTANVGAGEVAANLAVLSVDAQGRTMLDVFSSGHVVIDVLGWFAPTPAAVGAGRYQALAPARLLDTRAPAGPGNEYVRVARPGGATVTLRVTDRAGIPVGATAVALTVTAVSAASDPSGFVTVHASGTAVPPHSNVNSNGALDTRANLAIVPVGAGGSIDLVLSGVSDVVVDVAGWVTGSGDAPGTAGRLHLLPLTRVADSRAGIGLATLPPGGSATLDSGVIPQGAAGIVQNVTMASTAASGWICATPQPFDAAAGAVSVQNASGPGQDRPALLFSRIGPGPGDRLRYCTYERTDLIVDVTGWFE